MFGIGVLYWARTQRYVSVPPLAGHAKSALLIPFDAADHHHYLSKCGPPLCLSSAVVCYGIVWLKLFEPLIARIRVRVRPLVENNIAIALACCFLYCQLLVAGTGRCYRGTAGPGHGIPLQRAVNRTVRSLLVRTAVHTGYQP